MLDIGHDFAGIQDYLLGRLSPEESCAFEDRLVRDPRLVGELEHYLRFREGLQQLHLTAACTRQVPRRASLRAWSLGLAAAATVAGVALLCVPLGADRPTALLTALPAQAANSAAATVTGQFTFVSTRGGSRPELSLPAGGVLEMRGVPAEPTPAARYRMVLVRQPSQGSSVTLGSLGGVAVSPDGYVHGYVDAARLMQGDYELRLEPDTGAPSRATVFPFELRAHLTAAFH